MGRRGAIALGRLAEIFRCGCAFDADRSAVSWGCGKQQRPMTALDDETCHAGWYTVGVNAYGISTPAAWSAEHNLLRGAGQATPESHRHAGSGQVLSWTERQLAGRTYAFLLLTQQLDAYTRRRPGRTTPPRPRSFLKVWAPSRCAC